MPDWYKERFESEEKEENIQEENVINTEFGFLEPLKGFKSLNI
jgi:hypothetical protein